MTAARSHITSSVRPRRWPATLALGLFAPGLLALGPACVRDPDCGICDPDALVLESVAGVNYAGKLVKLLGPACEGPECPGALTEGTYFVDKIVPCVDTPEAAKAPRGVDEWCKVSPLVVDSGLQFIFNNLLDPTSVELVRKKADNPQAMEVFDWKTRIVHLEGPISRFNGDYRKAASSTGADTITRATNLACIENLRKQGRAYDHAVLLAEPDICDGTYTAEDGRVWPLRALLERDGGGPATIETWRGETDARQAGQSCSPPKDGVDTCCDVCDLELAVNVAKYGVRAPVSELERPGDLRRDLADAITCDPAGDELRECRDFVAHVYRRDEVRSHEYMWDGEARRFRVPLADKLRETHPDDRPAGVEQRTVPCDSDADCTAESGAQLAGMACVGHLADDDGAACSGGDDCVERRCVAEWFVGCRADVDTTGAQGYCVDTRWVGKGAAGCFVADAPFYVCADAATCADENFADGKRKQGAGSRLAYADADGDGELAAVEGCRASLGAQQDGAACDPLYQPGVAAVDRYDRKQTLPSHTRACVCEDQPAEGCDEFVDRLCREDGEAGRPIVAARRGQYALKFVSRPGGVIYDPAIKGVLFLPADLGGVPRSMVETCAAQRGDIGDHSVKDGWRANDIGPELFEDFDRAMCSSATYRVVFNSEPGPGDAPLEYIRDKVGNTLRGKTTYTLHTPDFHVLPGSGFPTDNLRIGACGAFELRFSNKYDMGAENLRKLEIREITEDGARELGTVAGGPGCSEDPMDGRPCLVVDIKDQDRGAIRVSIDTRRFGAGHLQPGHRYRLAVPGLELAPGETVHDVIAAGGDRYREAFWDACGMPLVTAMPRLDAAGLLDPDGATRDPDSRYDFTIDAPKPKEDADQDGVQRSCDNAEKAYNPDQEDMDDDGFGDVIDLCPTLASDSNSADADKDGVGNDCDRCSRQPTTYNSNYDDSDARFNLRVRNIPHQGDLDQDGVGDACDNCVVRPNCGGFGPVDAGLQPAGVGDPVPLGDAGKCQTDVDALPFIGDACAPDGVPLELDGAAGPVGFGDDDDFDQDGLRNLDDVCPRQPLPRVACVDAADCPAGAACTAGVCNHIDHDNDGHGDICDNCPDIGNFGQTLDGALQTDDPDGDFVGNACEAGTDCNGVAEPRRIAFYSEHSEGQCCVRLFDEAAGVLDPGAARVDDDGTCEVLDLALPLRVDCPEDQENVTCRPLPPRVRNSPGVVDLPFGCAGVGTPMTLDSPGVDGDPNKLYKFMCLMPHADQDFDGVGDGCDLCPYAFDPNNSLYKDSNNKVWPGSGMFCRGPYDPEKGLRSCDGVGDTDTDTDTAGTSGDASSTGAP